MTPAFAKTLENLLFIAVPYVALVLFFFVTIQRYRQRKFTYSSLSSQFLENRQHFWALVPFHYGILTVVGLHLAFLLIPKQILDWNAAPARLYALEITGFAAALLTLVGGINVLFRRLGHHKLRVITTKSDWVLYLLLLVQVATGLAVALLHRWGSSWFASAMGPYVWSLLTFRPDLGYLAGTSWLIKAHIVNAFVIIGFFPFTRLVHVLVVPNQYLFRKTQVVRWNHDRLTLRKVD